MKREDYNKAVEKVDDFRTFMASHLDELSYMITPFLYGEPDARDFYRPRWVHNTF